MFWGSHIVSDFSFGQEEGCGAFLAFVYFVPFLSVLPTSLVSHLSRFWAPFCVSPFASPLFRQSEVQYGRHLLLHFWAAGTTILFSRKGFNAGMAEMFPEDF